MPHVTADATNYAALPLEGRDAFTGSRVTFYENAVLTIDGVSSTVTDVSVSFSADATEQCAPLDLSPITFTIYSEWTPEQRGQWDTFIAAMPKPMWPQWVRLTAWGETADVPVFAHDTWESFRDRMLEANAELWERACAGMKRPWRSRGFSLRRTKRRAKAKAKRAKMRAARYAARWEQAHLRGEK